MCPKLFSSKKCRLYQDRFCLKVDPVDLEIDPVDLYLYDYININIYLYRRSFYLNQNKIFK